jgi:PEP-CTERM motif-containing protein
MRYLPRILVVLSFVLGISAPGFASSIVVDFESFSDTDVVTTQVSGLVFSNTIVLTAGASLNEFDFPPRSGSNVVADLGAPILITFASPISSFSAFFTYTEALTLNAFDASATQVDVATSLFGNNSVGFGGIPNELVEVAFVGGISSVLITGNPAGFSFTMDDVTYTATGSQSPVPEPGTLGLLAIGLQGLRSRIRNKRA